MWFTVVQLDAQDKLGGKEASMAALSEGRALLHRSSFKG